MSSGRRTSGMKCIAKVHSSIPRHRTFLKHSYCFDYIRLKEQFEINLERANSDKLDDDGKEEKEVENEKEQEQDLPFY